MDSHIADQPVGERVDACDWPSVAAHLDSHGWATLQGVLQPDECQSIVTLYEDEDQFRARIVMARHGFGQGEYKYISYPPGDHCRVADRSLLAPRTARQ